MTVTRRQVIRFGGGLIAALGCPLAAAGGDDAVAIEMAGRPDGSRVWFDPVGLWIEPGQTVRWTNRDPGNAHTATAYHPDNFGRPARIPESAEPWDSDYLLPDEAFAVTLRRPGVYDYYCVPHEAAGMVGRIVVGQPDESRANRGAGADAGIPAAALRAFPPVRDIMERRRIRHDAARDLLGRRSWG